LDPKSKLKLLENTKNDFIDSDMYIKTEFNTLSDYFSKYTVFSGQKLNQWIQNSEIRDETWDLQKKLKLDAKMNNVNNTYLKMD